MAFFEKKGIVHRDIKPANIVIKDPSDPYNIYFIDFGFAEELTDIQNMKEWNSVCGTPGYLGPEVIVGKQYDTKVDVFGLGCTFYQILLGKSPFVGKEFKQIIRANYKCDFKANYERDFKSSRLYDFQPETKQLLELMMSRNPRDRPLASEL